LWWICAATDADANDCCCCSCSCWAKSQYSGHLLSARVVTTARIWQNLSTAKSD
jgi:hypothetical protein